MAKAYRIEWRPMARQDLRRIVRYIGKDSPTRAANFGEGLRAKTEPLARHPELGRPGRLKGTRELIAHPNYIIFYRVLHETWTVQILWTASVSLAHELERAGGSRSGREEKSVSG